LPLPFSLTTTGAFQSLFNDGIHGSVGDEAKSSAEESRIFRDELEDQQLVFDGDSLDWVNSYGDVLQSWPAVSEERGHKLSGISL
jgi:hypothetical protein